MDEQDAEYLRQQIHDLERSRGRWRVAALVSWIALGLGLVTTQRMRVRAMEAEMEAREQAERARQAEMEARKQAERAKVNKEVEGLPNDKTGKNTGGVRQP
jgi:uncharacterized protein HemX